MTVRLGLGVLVSLLAAACIFEQGTYQGGGRRDDGDAELEDAGAEEDEDPTPTPAPTSTSTGTVDSGGAPTDAGAG